MIMANVVVLVNLMMANLVNLMMANLVNLMMANLANLMMAREGEKAMELLDHQIPHLFGD